MQTNLIHSSEAPLFNVFGPLQQFLVAPAETGGAFGIMRAIVPPKLLLEVLRYETSDRDWVPQAAAMWCRCRVG